MAYKIDDETHFMADEFISRKYVARSDERQKALGLSYITAEKNDLVCEIAAFARMTAEPRCGFEVVRSRHFNALCEALAEIKATSDGESDQPIKSIIEWCLSEIEASAGDAS